jgi:hypothetical protein
MVAKKIEQDLAHLYYMPLLQIGGVSLNRKSEAIAVSSCVESPNPDTSLFLCPTLKP